MSRVDEKKILGVGEIKKNQKEDVFEIKQKLKVSDDKIDEGGLLKDDVNEIEENLRVDVFEIVEKLKIYNKIFNELNFGFMELKFEFINGKLIVIEGVDVDQYLVLQCYGNFSCNDLIKVVDLEVLEGSNLEEFDKGGFIVIDFNFNNKDLGKVNVNNSEVQIEE